MKICSHLAAQAETSKFDANGVKKPTVDRWFPMDHPPKVPLSKFPVTPVRNGQESYVRKEMKGATPVRNGQESYVRKEMKGAELEEAKAVSCISQPCRQK